MSKNKILSAFEFLKDKYANNIPFTTIEMAVAIGWAESTVRTYLSKQWDHFTEKIGVGQYKVMASFLDYDPESFLRRNSQKHRVNKDPFKPILAKEVEDLLDKSRESALLAIQIYNNPMIKFRTPGYIVHMIIAYTSLFHAAFIEDGTNPVYVDNDNSIKTIDGSPKMWELTKCLKEYWKGEDNPIKKNIELFIKLRNEIEHRYAPAFDSFIAGECQALLINYEQLIVDEFSPYYAIGAQVAVPIQISAMSSSAKIQALKNIQAADYNLLKDYVQRYRYSLGHEIANNTEYSFKAFLIQVPANRIENADTVIKFIKYEDISPEELDKIKNDVAFIKTKKTPIANFGLMNPKKVVRIIQETEPRFSLHLHTQAWRYFKVRSSGTPGEGFDPKYCSFDDVHKDYSYSQAWVAKLQKAFKDPSFYEKLYSYKDASK